MATSVCYFWSSITPLNPHISFFLLTLFVFILPLASSLHFQISRFDPLATNVIREGDAIFSAGAIEFNDVNFLYRVGRATYAEKVRLWNSDTGKLSDFICNFSFTIDTLGLSRYGHGIAFFLAPIGFQIPQNSAGGFLGLFNTTTGNSSTNQIVLVEFDSFPNPEWDPPYEHVGINKNSIASAVTTPWNASLHSGDRANAQITYNSTTKNLSVFWTYQATPQVPGNSSLSYQIDLMEVLPEWVIIGFSAATGQFIERHTLHSWEFSSSLDANESSGKNEKRIRLIVGLTVPIGVLILWGILAFVIFWRRSTRKETMKKTNYLTSSINDDLERGAGPRRLTYEDLALATRNFSDEGKLGEGGFGCVYKGYLQDLDLLVAVKKISRGSKQGRKEYITEVKIISWLRHRNLVQLIGCCHDQGKFLLVYEFMPNGSLDAHLFGKKSPLSWAVRYKIALGLASALLYLHEEWEQCVVHRDIKPSNIMLDSSFSAKLGDFGLAKLMDHEQGPQTTVLAGTIGYLALEYIRTRKASKESDVYSFGVVLLEIATGRKSVDLVEEKSDVGLVEWVGDLHERGQILSAVDRRINMDFDTKQAECLTIVGLWCAHPEHNHRPSIRQAIQVLRFDTSLPNLPTEMPVAMFQPPAAPRPSSSRPSLTNTSMDGGR